MDALEALRNRRSVRRYKPTPVPRDMIEKIVDAARLAASAVNVQPWEFVAITDPDMRKRIADATDHGKFIAEAPLCIAVFCKDTKYYLEDGSAAAQNILVAATALGLGSCWVAGDKKTYSDNIRQHLAVPTGHKLIALVPIGYSDEPEKTRTKRELGQVLHYEKF